MADDFTVNGSPPEEVENRTFVIAAAGLGGLIVLSLICLGLYALVLAPRQRQAQLEAPTQIALQNTMTAEALTATREAELASPTIAAPTDTPVPTATNTSTPAPTATPVVVLPTDTPSATAFTTLPTVIPETATAAAAQTQTQEAIAGGAGTETPTPTTAPSPTATALPTAGFADEVGLPGLFLLAAVLLVVVFLSRRLRTGVSTG